MWKPQRLITVWASMACYGDGFTLYHICGFPFISALSAVICSSVYLYFVIHVDTSKECAAATSAQAGDGCHGIQSQYVASRLLFQCCFPWHIFILTLKSNVVTYFLLCLVKTGLVLMSAHSVCVSPNCTFAASFRPRNSQVFPVCNFLRNITSMVGEGLLYAFPQDRSVHS